MRISDWSSDVCSSDLQADRQKAGEHHQHQSGVEAPETHLHQAVVQAQVRATVAQHQKSEAQREEAVDAKQRRMGMERRGVQPDRKRDVWGKRVSVRVGFGGGRSITNKKTT